MMRALRIAVGLGLLLLARAGWTAEEPAPQSNQPFRYDAHGRRDPFVPLVRDGRFVGSSGGLQSSADKPVLYGILWDAGGVSVALINDVEAKVGDTINGYEVKEIRQDAVVLSNGDESLVLQIAFETSPSEASPDTAKGGERRGQKSRR